MEKKDVSSQDESFKSGLVSRDEIFNILHVIVISFL